MKHMILYLLLLKNKLINEPIESVEKPVVDNADKALNSVILKVEPTP